MKVTAKLMKDGKEINSTTIEERYLSDLLIHMNVPHMRHCNSKSGLVRISLLNDDSHTIEVIK